MPSSPCDAPPWQVGLALRLARALNRSLVLPRLVCGDEARAFPCLAMHHRSRPIRLVPRLNISTRLALPPVCPLHYWVDPELATRLDVHPPNHLSSPPSVGASSADGESALDVLDASGAGVTAALVRRLSLRNGRVLRVRNLVQPAGDGKRPRLEKDAQGNWPARLVASRWPNELTGMSWCRSCAGVQDHASKKCVESQV